MALKDYIIPIARIIQIFQRYAVEREFPRDVAYISIQTGMTKGYSKGKYLFNSLVQESNPPQYRFQGLECPL